MTTQSSENGAVTLPRTNGTEMTKCVGHTAIISWMTALLPCLLMVVGYGC